MLVTNIALFNLFGVFEMFHITNDMETLTKDEIISCTIWVVIDFYFITSIIVSSELFSKEAMEAQKLLHNIENQSVDYKVVKTVSGLLIYFIK